MKKNIFVMAALAVLATACVKEQQPTDQAPADVDVEKTVLAVSVEPTKAVVDEGDGAVSFQKGDELAVWFQTGTEITGEGENAKETAVGTRVVFTYVENNEDGSATYTRHHMYLYKEDFAKFTDGLNEMIEFVKTNKPEYFDSHNEGDKE